jgi:hypothetical protein
MATARRLIEQAAVILFKTSPRRGTDSAARFTRSPRPPGRFYFDKMRRAGRDYDTKS